MTYSGWWFQSLRKIWVCQFCHFIRNWMESHKIPWFQSPPTSVYIYIYHISHQISLLWLAINPIYYGKSTSSLLIEVSWKNSAGVFWSPRCIVLGISGMRLRVRGWGEALKWMEMMGIWMVSGPCLIIKCNQIPGWWLILVNSGIIVA